MAAPGPPPPPEDNSVKRREFKIKGVKKSENRRKGRKNDIKRKRYLIVLLYQLYLEAWGRKFKLYLFSFISEEWYYYYPQLLKGGDINMISPKNIIKFPPLTMGKRNPIF